MTALEKEIQNLPKIEKISIMEQVWDDLMKEEGSIEIPNRHVQELEETENRIKEGKEHFLDELMHYSSRVNNEEPFVTIFTVRIGFPFCTILALSSAWPVAVLIR